MHPDLERLIRLQQLDTFVETARRAVAEHPARVQALESRLDEATRRLTSAQQALAANQTDRRSLDKDLAAVQGRLSKFKDQLMEVKTNREYTAMLKEIEVAQQEVRRLEDRMLERMLEADEFSGAMKASEKALAAERVNIREERDRLEQEIATLAAELETSLSQRQQLVQQIDPQAMAIFETVARGRRGVAVAEAKDGLCTICHVRLRPQRFNEVRRNADIIQCDSCQRILYFAGPAAVTETS
jgi:predicted  nucleic acid-binding Zn-ribbon protein